MNALRTTHTQTYIHTQTYVHTQTYIHTNTHIHTQNIHTHTLTYTQIHTYTHKSTSLGDPYTEGEPKEYVCLSHEISVDYPSNP